jgi:hypothetical protein
MERNFEGLGPTPTFIMDEKLRYNTLADESSIFPLLI